MSWEERKKKIEENKESIRTMTDKEKVSMLIDLLKEEEEIDMLTSCSDTHGIEFTEEYYKLQDKKEEILEALYED